LDFILELISANGEWLIESSVRGGGRDRDDVVLEFPDRLAITDQEMLAELDGATRMIAESRTRALQTFVLDYVG
jgi:hypothetical protein